MASKLSPFLAELKRRKVYNVAAAYAAVGVAISIAVPDLFGAFHFPPWAAPLVIMVIAIGLPIALVLAWAYEVKPEEPREPEPATSATLGTPDTERRKAIVVLPFDNMSPDPGDAYFADGLTEEIITNLSQIHSLRVISRNSAMVLKGTQKDTRTIAAELDVSYVLEGSVRKAGSDLRITAQLIDAASDEHLWAEKYNGVLEDVFAMQEQVSCSIVEALSLEITPEEGAGIREKPVEEPRAWESYLRARQEMYRLSEDGLNRAIQEANNGLEITGENPLLLSIIGTCYFQFVNLGFRDLSYLDRAEEVAKRVLDLDAKSPHGLRLLGNIHYKRGKMIEAIRAVRAAWKSNPHDPDTLIYLNYWYGDVGRPVEMGPLVQQLLEENPLEPSSWWAAGWYELLNSRLDSALGAWQRAHVMDPDTPVWRLYFGLALAHRARFSEACLVLEALEHEPLESMFRWLGQHLRGAIEECEAKMPGNPPEETRARLWSDEHCSWITAAGFARGGSVDEALEWLERAADLGLVNYPLFAEIDPLLAGIRGESRFRTLMKHIKHEWENFEV